MVNLDGKKAVFAGMALSFTDSSSDYPASDGYTLKYSITNAQRTYTLESTADGDDHDFAIATATTGGWIPGKYRWTAYADLAGELYAIGAGDVEIKADPTSAGDQRSHVEKVLDAIETVLEGKASSDAASLSIGGKSISRYSPAELREWRKEYRRELKAMRRAEKLEQGRASGRTIRTRF